MTTITEETTVLANWEAAGEAKRRADALIAEAHDHDRQRREKLAQAAYEQNLAEALRERARAQETAEKAASAEQEASQALDAAAEAEATAARQSIDARYAAERAAEALMRAQETGAEPAELVELDMRASSADRVAGHAETRLGDVQSERGLRKRALERAREDAATARTKLAAACLAAMPQNVERPPVPAQELTWGEIAAQSMAVMAERGYGRRRG